MSSKRTLLVLALMLAPLLAQSNYVTWDGLAKFMAAYSGVSTFINATFGLLPYVGIASIILALVLAVINAIVTYIFARLAVDLIK